MLRSALVHMVLGVMCSSLLGSFPLGTRLYSGGISYFNSRSCLSFLFTFGVCFWGAVIFSSMPQAYGYDDHGISEMWMQKYMGEAQDGAASASQKAGVGQLSDEAIRVQVWDSPRPVLYRGSRVILEAKPCFFLASALEGL